MADRFSIGAMCRAKLAGTWSRVPSTESRIIETLHERYGLPDSGYDALPDDVFQRATPLTTLASTNGGYLIDQPVVGYLAALQPASITLQLGATPVILDKGGAILPHGANAVQTFWASDEVTPLNAGPPTFGAITFARHNLFAFCQISRQLLLQSNADEVVTSELGRAIGTALDVAVLGGSGSAGQPTGIINTAGIGTVTGTSLNYAAIISAMSQVSTANAVQTANRLGFAATPAVAALLKARYRVATGEFPLWAGQIAAGNIEDAPAFACMNMPASSLIYGDWSQLLLAQWPDGLSMAVDPFSAFQQGIVGIRACISIDVQLRTPLAFVAATGIT